MKINIMELRDMVATAVRQTIAEAKKKPKMAAPRSEESIEAQRKRQLTGLPGYAHGGVLDMSKPLGKRNLAKRQGAAGMGNWTSESTVPGPSGGDDVVQKIIATLVKSGMPHEKAARIAPELAYSVMAPSTPGLAKAKPGNRMVDPAAHGMDDPAELGIEAKHEAIRHLVRLVVAEEINLVKRRR